MGNNQRGNAPKKEKINEWTGIGVVIPRSGKPEDEIKFYPFEKTGGGVIHFTLKCEEPFGGDANGQPKVTTTYIPVSVRANKNITIEQLKSVRSGMKVRVVGPLKAESYTKQSGEKVTTIVANAFVFEVLQMPMMQPPYNNQPSTGYSGQPQGNYPGYPAPGAVPPYGAPPQGNYSGYPAPGAAPSYGGQPQGNYPGYPAPGAIPPYGAPPQGNYPGYPAPGAAPHYDAQPGAGAPVAPVVPPYYHQPPQGGGTVPAAGAASVPPTGNPMDGEDLPL